MSDAPVKIAAYIPLSAEAMRDCTGLSSGLEVVIDAQLEAIRLAWAEETLNGHIGPHHRPGRQQLWDVQRPQRRAAQIRGGLARMMPGKSPGRFRKASHE